MKLLGSYLLVCACIVAAPIIAQRVTQGVDIAALRSEAKGKKSR